MLTNPADFCNFMIFRGLTMVIPSVIYRHCLQDVGGQVIEHTSCAVLSQDHNAVFCPLAMDYTPAIVVGSFLSGWLSRDWISTKPEVPACQCVCNWTGERPALVTVAIITLLGCWDFSSYCLPSSPFPTRHLH